MASGTQSSYTKNLCEAAGDDVGAIVLDFGSYCTRIGFAGEDAPKQLWNSACGERSDITDDEKAPLIYPLNPYVRRDNISLRPLFFYDDEDLTEYNKSIMCVYNDSEYGNFDKKTIEKENTKGKNVFSPLPTVLPNYIRRCNGTELRMDESVFECIIESCLPVDSIKNGGLGINIEEHPILLSEPTRHNRNLREKMIEIIFEKFNAPASYLCKRGVLAAFGVGRSSGLVCHIGSNRTCISPISDGFCLQKPMCEYPIGGNLLDSQLSLLLSLQGHMIAPNYAYKKTLIDKSSTPGFKAGGLINQMSTGHNITNTYNPLSLINVTDSYLLYSRQQIIRDIKESCFKFLEDDISSDVSKIANQWYRLFDLQTSSNGKQSKQALVSSSSCLINKNIAELPDGTKILSDNFSCIIPEMLFNPELIFLSFPTETKLLPFSTHFGGKPNKYNFLNNSINSNSLTNSQPMNTSLNNSSEFTNLGTNIIDSKNVIDTLTVLRGFRGLPHAIGYCINECDTDIKKDLLSAIILTGGSSLIPNLPNRLGKTLQEDDSYLGANTRFKIIAPATAIERKFTSWIGGSILSSLGTFQQLWFSIQEYNEHGAHLAERKCP